MWWYPHNFEKKKDTLLTRMRVIKAIRTFFDAQAFWEVDTPALQVTPGLDTHIHGMKVPVRDVNLKPERALYLHTSPEFAMKKLLVAGCEKIYQICHCYRDGENTKLHSSEFTMIEWYRSGASYETLMSDCEDLLRCAAKAANIKHFMRGDHTCDPFQNIERLTVTDAFKAYADLDLEDLWDIAAFHKAAANINIRTADDDAWDDIFHRVMGAKIEPFLGMDRPTILTDYPVSMAALARQKLEDPRFAERFELYVCGIELANAFGELTDPIEQRARFTADMTEKTRLYGESYPLDEDFLAALAYGMPPSSGIALGLDRLVMLCTGAEKIDDVLWTAKP
jgi:lysyl-tRNA synthetase class 2